MSRDLALSPDGARLVVVDDRTLFAYDAATEAPTWTTTLHLTVRDVGFTDQHVVALLTDGTLVALDGVGGVAWSVKPGGHALVTGEHGRWAVLDKTVVRAGVGASVTDTWPVEGGVAGAFGDGHLAVATKRRTLVLVHDTAEDAAPREVEYGGDDVPNAVAWSPVRLWLVSQGEQVRYYDPDDGSSGRCARYENSAVSGVVATGRLYGFRVDDDYAAVLAFPKGHELARLSYADRKVGAVALLDGRLAVSVGAGHANLVDLKRGSVARTDEHPGQERGSWLVRFNVDTAWWEPAPAPAADPPPAEAPAEPEGGASLTTVLLALVGLAVIAAACAGAAPFLGVVLP